MEMYRVSRRRVVLFEPYDNCLVGDGGEASDRAGPRPRSRFLHAHVGVRNGCVPNYVYRWTEKEIIKTISAFAPYGAHTFRFIHRVRIPWTQLEGRRNRLLYYAARMSVRVVRLLGWAFPRQSNCLAAIGIKPELPRDLHRLARLERGKRETQPRLVARAISEASWCCDRATRGS
jgi:hypothetical protein